MMNAKGKPIELLTTVPKHLFRLSNNGPSIVLRWKQSAGLWRGRGFDIAVQNGRVKPEALSLDTYQGPNGVVMHPNNPTLQKAIRTGFTNPGVLVFSLPAGTRLPDELILVKTPNARYHLEPAKEMSFSEFLGKVRSLLHSKGRCYTREQWLDEHRKATDFEASGRREGAVWKTWLAWIARRRREQFAFKSSGPREGRSHPLTPSRRESPSERQQRILAYIKE